MYRGRRIPPDEAQRVLARALEMQRAQGGGRELGEAELARIAGELGVDADVLRAAMSGTSDADVSAAKSAFTGTPLRLAFERRAPRAIDASDHPRIVEAIRRATEHDGVAGSVGDRIEWSCGSYGRRRGGGTRMRVTATPSEGSTIVRVEQDLRSTAGGLFGGVLGSVGTNALVWAILAPAVFGVGLWLTALLLSMIVLTYGVLRLSFGAYVRSRREALGRVVDAIAAEAAVAANVRVAARSRVSDRDARESDTREDAR